MGLSFTNRQTVEFKKNETAGLSQLNARKNNRQLMKISQSMQSPGDSMPKYVLVADDSLLANTFGFLLL